METKELIENGHAAGEAWAKNQATPKELENLLRADPSVIGWNLYDKQHAPPGEFGWPGHVLERIRPDEPLDQEHVGAFLAEIGAPEDLDERNLADWLRAFVEGAEDVGRAVPDVV